MNPQGWANVSFQILLSEVRRVEKPLVGKKYRQVGVRLWGKGAYQRDVIDGSETKYGSFFRLEENDVVMNKIWARNGSIAIVQPELAGSYVSAEFPIFRVNPELLDPKWMSYFAQTPLLWRQCEDVAKGSTGKNRISVQQFLQLSIPLPPLAEQHRIIDQVERLMDLNKEADRMLEDLRQDSSAFLLACYQRIIKSADWRPFGDVATRQRRKVNIQIQEEYLEAGVRSFGKGTFHKLPVTGAQLGGKRVFRMEPNDLVFNIVFAWEGAIAVVQPKDSGRIGSHRFLTYTADPKVTTPDYLCYHFLTANGLADINRASPGAAGRNRTLSARSLEQILVPIPTLTSQQWFGELLKQNSAFHREFEDFNALSERFRASILSKAFRGELIPQDSNDEAIDKVLQRLETKSLKREAKIESVQKNEKSTEENKVKEYQASQSENKSAVVKQKVSADECSADDNTNLNELYAHLYSIFGTEAWTLQDLLEYQENIHLNSVSIIQSIRDTFLNMLREGQSSGIQMFYDITNHKMKFRLLPLDSGD